VGRHFLPGFSSITGTSLGVAFRIFHVSYRSAVRTSGSGSTVMIFEEPSVLAPLGSDIDASLYQLLSGGWLR